MAPARLEDSDDSDPVRSRHAAYYRRLAENANERLRGARAPEWSERLTPELGNLKAAIDWHLGTGNIDAALSMVSGMAWLWFVNSDFAEGARWLASALGAEGKRRAELHATALVWHGYCVGMSFSPAAGVVECEEAIAVLRPGGDPVRLAEALLLGASVLIRAHQFSQSLEALAEAQTLLGPDDQRWLPGTDDTMETQMHLGPHEHGWLLGTHDMLVSWNMASFGRLDEAEAAALSSIERFDAAGEVLLVVNALNALAGVAAAKGDFEGASVAYEALLERCRATEQHPYLPFCLVSLAGVRARQGDATAADHLYEEAIGCSYNPWLSADAMVGQAAVARHLGDLARARGLLDTAAERYRDADLPAGQARVLAGLAWWAIGTDQSAAAVTLRSRCRQSRKSNRGFRIPTARRFRPGRSQRDRKPHSAKYRPHSWSWPNSEPQVPRIAPSPTSQIWRHSRPVSHQPRPEQQSRSSNPLQRPPSQAVALAPQHHLRAASGHGRILTVMHRDPERPNTSRGRSGSAWSCGRGPRSGGHGQHPGRRLLSPSTTSRGRVGDRKGTLSRGHGRSWLRARRRRPRRLHRSVAESHRWPPDELGTPSY